MPRAKWYELEFIIDERIGAHGEPEFLAKWDGYAVDHPTGMTWEPGHHFQQDALDEWARSREGIDDLDRYDEDEESERRAGYAASARSIASSVGDRDLDDSEEAANDGKAKEDGGEEEEGGWEEEIVVGKALTVRTTVVSDADEDSVARHEPGPLHESDGEPPGSHDDNHLERRSLSPSEASRHPNANVYELTDPDAFDSTIADGSGHAAQDEESEADSDDIQLPPDHTVPSEPQPPHAITGESDEGTYRVIWKPHSTTGKQPGLAWIRKELVSPTLVAVWDELKDKVLPDDRAGEEELDGYYVKVGDTIFFVNMGDTVVLIEPKQPGSDDGTPGHKDGTSEPIELSAESESSTASNEPETPPLTTTQAAQILVQLAISDGRPRRDSALE